MSLFALGLWAAICVRDPNYSGCVMRPGQCAELDGVEVCVTDPPKTGQKK